MSPTKKNISQRIHHRFVRVSIYRLKLTARKGLVDGIPKNLPDLEEPCPICVLIKATKINIVPTIDVSECFDGFMLQMDFAFFNIESIR